MDTLNHPQPVPRHAVQNGAKFGHWTVLDKGYPKSLCRCSCGLEKWVRNDTLGESSLSCGHVEKPQQTLVGSKYGELTVLSVKRSTNGVLIAVCRCSCGSEVEIRKANLPRTTTCGHWKRTNLQTLQEEYPDIAVESLRRLRAVWFSMKKRCSSPESSSYERYGGRGIYVCDEWNDLYAFVSWSISMKYEQGLTLDRIDNNGPYSPENCRWVSDYEQARNKRTNRWVKAWGEERIMTDWLSDPRCVVRRSCLKNRLDNGWDPERAITTPPRCQRP